ncbi:Uncharacterized protein DBV15_08422 [Temnothorax longispinosus]|uniref:Uncharacterized protein n=1 Tax=Temnothorax longispinosus TaxID=300112 RepID=A0A4S2L0Z8_9HYME|nr:Uncharacterized protein DBV15_08422 [Temnothorax longispinosus]
MQDRRVYAPALDPIDLRLAPGIRICRVNALRAVRPRRQTTPIRDKEKAREGVKVGKAFFAPIGREARGIERSQATP